MKLKQIAILTACLAFFLTCVSCGKPSKRDIANEPKMRAKIDGFAKEMKQLAKEFPKKPFDLNLTAPLNPAPAYHIFDSFSNTAVIMLNQMEDVMRVWKAKENELDLYTSAGMIYTFRDSYLSEEAEEGWLESLESYLNIRYVVVVRTLKYVPPKIIDGGKFTGGMAEMMVALYDRQTKKWLYAGKMVALPPKQVDYRAKTSQLDEAGISEVRSNNRKRIEELIDERLSKLTNGFFEFDSSAPKGEVKNH